MENLGAPASKSHTAPERITPEQEEERLEEERFHGAHRGITATLAKQRQRNVAGAHLDPGTMVWPEGIVGVGSPLVGPTGDVCGTCGAPSVGQVACYMMVGDLMGAFGVRWAYDWGRGSCCGELWRDPTRRGSEGGPRHNEAPRDDEGTGRGGSLRREHEESRPDGESMAPEGVLQIVCCLCCL